MPPTSRWSAGLVLLAVMALLPAAAFAQADLETRARSLEGKIMAPCCMANPVSDHFSGAADDIRKEIRVMLRQGRTDQAILDSYVREYGEQILAMPKAEGFNLAAYLLPGAALVLGIMSLIVVLCVWQARTGDATRNGEDPARPTAMTPDPEMLRRIEMEVRERS